MLDRLREIIAQRCEDWGGELSEFNGEPDHVYVLVELPPNLELSRFVNNAKTTFSRLIRRDFGRERRGVYRKPVFWSRASCIITWGGRPIVGAQALRGAASNAGMTRACAGGLHPQLALRAQAAALHKRGRGALALAAQAVAAAGYPSGKPKAVDDPAQPVD
jgi:putative transposase